MNKNSLSIFISLILRHKPETIGIKLDENGWANVNELIDGINKSKYNITFEILNDIVITDNKNRYSFNENKTLIRANQGHSIFVDLELKEAIPPKILYHGTAEKFLDDIMTNGIKPMKRMYVHLSDNKHTAKIVGSRHGTATILKIDTAEMIRNNYKFYISNNNVWLTKFVPNYYIIKGE